MHLPTRLGGQKFILTLTEKAEGFKELCRKHNVPIL